MHPTGQAHLKTTRANTHPKYLNKLALPYPQKRKKASLKKTKFSSSALPTLISTNFATDTFRERKKKRPSA